MTWQPTLRAWSTAFATSLSKSCTTLSVARMGTRVAALPIPTMPVASSPRPAITLAVEVP